jgi:hypothetical protein
MKVKVRTLLKRGRLLPQQEGHAIPPYVGVLSIGEGREPKLGRTVVRASLVDPLQGQGIELLPELTDARVLWLEDGKFRVGGFEWVDNAAYSQTWAVEVL